ncbi:hypothetical protein AB0I22_09515 [Streptomyces sp. NPDC050610]|uniref:hypothetical protein n=1 Tax=Streptomyces sp. NPDC050610 TaxID=3157097 RepID=UPI0034334887
MVNDRAGSEEHGYGLLMAAVPPSKQPMDATAALHQLAAVPPTVLLGTPFASVVQLVSPDAPNTVLTHLRTAAAAPGPLLLYLAGHLQLDRKQQLPHLALARTTASTVRYTALPWHWLTAELRDRPPGSTTVLADLVADEAVWQRLTDKPGFLSGPYALYGTVAPPPARRRDRPVPAYSQALATLLRTRPERPPVEQLHHEAANHAGLASGPGYLLASTPHAYTAPEPAGSEPIPRHPEPAPDPGRRLDIPAPAPGPDPASAPESAPRPHPEPHSEPRPEHTPEPSSGPVPASSSGPVSGPAPDPVPRPRPEPQPHQSQPQPHQPHPAPRPEPHPEPHPDPHPAILEAAHAGRHSEAAAMAAAWEQEAWRAHGPGSLDVIHWTEVRADLARLAEEPAKACGLWMHAATQRMNAGQPETHPEVQAAADRAHHCWQQVVDPRAVRALGPELIDLRTRVPGSKEGALQAVRQRIANLDDNAPVA